jgi:UDP-N-acetylglucosamine/UDP-N-acetylgalactosamine diphosphorylase
MSPEAGLVERLERHGQGHLLRWWGELDDAGRLRLAADAASIDFPHLERLVGELVHGDGGGTPAADRVEPIEAFRLPQTDGERVAMRRAAGIGADALAAGEVGVILVAGGSGTRLGFEGPKGTFPIGPVSSASLFRFMLRRSSRCRAAIVASCRFTS